MEDFRRNGASPWAGAQNGVCGAKPGQFPQPASEKVPIGNYVKSHDFNRFARGVGETPSDFEKYFGESAPKPARSSTRTASLRPSRDIRSTL